MPIHRPVASCQVAQHQTIRRELAPDGELTGLRWVVIPQSEGRSVAGKLGGFRSARKLEEQIRLITHDPCIVAWLDDCEVARTKLQFGPIVHEYH